MDGDLLNCVNLKGTLADAPICDNTSSIRSWAVSSGLHFHEMVEWGKHPSATLCNHLGSILMLAHFVDRSVIPM